jgi:threonine aldolase
MQAYLASDLWLDMAEKSNAACARLAQGLKQTTGVVLDFEPQANIIFAQWPRAAHQRLHAAGAQYYVMAGDHTTGPADELLPARLVTDWSTSPDTVDRFLQIFRG